MGPSVQVLGIGQGSDLRGLGPLENNTPEGQRCWVSSKAAALLGFLPIYTHTLEADGVFDFDSYVFDGSDMILFCSSQLPLKRSRNVLLERSLNR